MAISDTITSMYENVGNVYDVLELAGADLTNVDKNIFNLKQSWEERLLYFLANGTDVIWNNWMPKVTGSGETITLNNTIEAKMDFVYKGNTYQYSTTGKNLLSLTNLTPSTKSGITLTKNNDGTITLNGTASADANFGFAIDNIVATSSYKVQLYKKGGSFTNNYVSIYMSVDSAFSNFDLLSLASSDFISMSLGNKTYTYAQIKVNSGVVCNNLVVGCQVVSDASITEFEKYTGGQPSPNPDYPQDIQVVSGDNVVEITGRNNFNIETYENATPTNNYHNTITTTDNTIVMSSTGNFAYRTIPYKIPASWVGEQVTFSFNGAVDRTSSTMRNRVGIGNIASADNTSYGYITLTTTPTDYSFTFTPTDEIIYITIYLNIQDTAITNATITNPQLEKNPTKTPFEPYTGETYPINLGNIELCKIGDYQDRIYKDNGKWYLNKQIGKVVLDGSENWQNQFGESLFGTNLTDKKINANSLSYCNYFNFHNIQSGLNTNLLNGEYTIQIGTTDTFYCKNTNYSNTTDFKTWLSTHNTTVYYVLATPTNTEITDTTLIYQLEAIKKSYNTQTSISQENNDLPFELDVVALGELESI